jgi:mannosyltransferase
VSQIPQIRAIPVRARPVYQSSTIGPTPSRLARSNRVSMVIFAGAACSSLLCALASRYIVPGLIRSAYQGASWTIFNRMIVNQADEPLSHYLTLWNAFAGEALLGLILFGCLLVIVARPEFQNIFWGPEPFCSTRASERAITGTPRFSLRKELAILAQSWEIALLFIALLLLALSLRLTRLGTNSLDQDEIFSAILARARLPGFLWTLRHGEGNMVLYYAILRFWNHFGQSDAWIRSFSVIPALATLPAVYRIGSRTFGRRVGIMAALLLAFNGFHVQYSQSARSYSLFVFLVTLSSFFFLQSVADGSRRNWIRYIATSTLALYAHLFAVFVLAAHWVFLLFLPRHSAPWRRLASSTVAIAFLGLPMEFLVFFRDNGRLSWIPRTSWRGVYSMFASLTGKPDDFFVLGRSTALLLFLYAIPVMISVVASAMPRLWSIDRVERRNLAFFLSWLLVPILLVLGVSVRKPMFVERYLLICLPPFILLASYGLSRLRKTSVAAAWICVIAGLTIPGLRNHYEVPRQDWREVGKYVAAKQRIGDAAVFFPTYYQSRLEYYLEKDKVKLFVPPHESPDGPLLSDLPAQHDRVWFIGKELAPVVDPPQIVGSQENAEAVQERLIQASLGEEFPLAREETHFKGGLVVILYRKLGVRELTIARSDATRF